MTGPHRRAEILDALRRGTVPRDGLAAFAVGMERFEAALQERARATGGFATSEVQVSETETPLHRWETVYRRLAERLATADTPDGALRSIVDAWFYTLEEDVLASGNVNPGDANELVAATDTLVEQRLSTISRTAPAFSAVLRAYRRALLARWSTERRCLGKARCWCEGGSRSIRGHALSGWTTDDPSRLWATGAGAGAR